MHTAGLFTLLVALQALLSTAAPSICKLHDLALYEEKLYSQNGEDGIVLRILEAVGFTNRYYVEFGVQDGTECNARILREHLNFTGLMMDGGNENAGINLKREFITVDNIIGIFRENKVPTEFDFLSVDTDAFDWWLLMRLLRDSPYRPRVIMVETNPSLGVGTESFRERFSEANAQPMTMVHPHLTDLKTWDLSRYHGANPAAFRKLGRLFGYEMVYCEMCGVNCILVHRDAIPTACGSAGFPMPAVHYPCFGTTRTGGSYPGHEVDLMRRRPVLLTDSLLALIATQIYSLWDVADNLYSPSEEYPLWGADWCTRLTDPPLSALEIDAAQIAQLQRQFSTAVQLFESGSYERAFYAFQDLLASIHDSDARCESRHWSEDACQVSFAFAQNAATARMRVAKGKLDWDDILDMLNRAEAYVSLGRGNSRVKAVAEFVRKMQPANLLRPVTTWFNFISQIGFPATTKSRIDMDVCSDPKIVAKEYCMLNNIPDDACSVIRSNLQSNYDNTYVKLPNAYYNIDHEKLLYDERLQPIVRDINAFNTEGCLRAPAEHYLASMRAYCDRALLARPLLLISGLASETIIGAASVVLKSLIGIEGDDMGHIILENATRGIIDAFECRDSYRNIHPALLDRDCLLRIAKGAVTSDSQASKISIVHSNIYAAVHSSFEKVVVFSSASLLFTHSYWRAVQRTDNEVADLIFFAPPIEMAVNSVATELQISAETALQRFIITTNAAIEALAFDHYTNVVILTISPQDSKGIAKWLAERNINIHLQNSSKFNSLLTILTETIPKSVQKQSIHIPYWFYKCYESIRSTHILPRSPCQE